MEEFSNEIYRKLSEVASKGTSTRTTRVLRRKGINTISELKLYLESNSVWKIDGLGESCITAICKLVELKPGKKNEVYDRVLAVSTESVATRAARALERKGISDVSALKVFCETNSLKDVKGIGKASIDAICSLPEISVKQKRETTRRRAASSEEKKNEIYERLRKVTTKSIATRTSRILERNGIRSIGELQAFCDVNRLQNIDGIGEACVSAVCRLSEVDVRKTGRLPKSAIESDIYKGLEEMGVSGAARTRILSALSREGVHTLDELREYSGTKELKKIKRLGNVCTEVLYRLMQ